MRARADVSPFELDVVEAPAAPTPSQLTSILEFVGKNRVDEIVRGTRSEEEAIRVLEEAGETTSERILRPLLVDWHNGRAGEFPLPFYLLEGRKEWVFHKLIHACLVLGAHESAVISLLDALPKK